MPPVRTRLYVDIHILQTVPPSNLNRDDAGSPKQATYGGARRARVSSQAWKRATRTAFVELLPASKLGTRTNKVAAQIAGRLVERTGLDPQSAQRVGAAAVFSQLGVKKGKKEGETAYLLFLGRAQLDQIADLLVDRAHELAAMDDKALTEALSGLAIREQLEHGHPVDVALFGRMVADIPALNVDAATQVAHALSTHAVDIEFDYFTAVDDENPDDVKGAGMIGTVEFNSATLYRFATVGVHQLAENLGDDDEAVAEALRAFLIGFVRSMPTGHQNSFAHRTAPHLAAFVVRQDQPVNLASAFEAPIRSTSGIAEESVARLAQELDRAAALWGLQPLSIATTYALPAGKDDPAVTAALGQALSFDTALAATLETVGKHLEEAVA